MKSAKSFAVILLFLSILFTNCSQDRDYLFTTNEIITRGNWVVEFFYNQVKTIEYENYSFQFSGNGTLQGTNGPNTVKGSWSVIHDVDYSDVLTITMNDQNTIAELGNSWRVKQKSVNALSLQGQGNPIEFRIRKL
jgi:hypothetical protein